MKMLVEQAVRCPFCAGRVLLVKPLITDSASHTTYGVVHPDNGCTVTGTLRRVSRKPERLQSALLRMLLRLYEIRLPAEARLKIAWRT